MSQAITLVGVVDDGTTLSPSVPSNTARQISFPKGATVTLDVRLVNNGGLPVEAPALATPAQLVFSMRRTGLIEEDECPELEKTTSTTLGSIQPNYWRFTFAPDDTRELELGRYLYDIWYEPGDGSRYQVVRVSDALLSPSIAA